MLTRPARGSTVDPAASVRAKMLDACHSSAEMPGSRRSHYFPLPEIKGRCHRAAYLHRSGVGDHRPFDRDGVVQAAEAAFMTVADRCRAQCRVFENRAALTGADAQTRQLDGGGEANRLLGSSGAKGECCGGRRSTTITVVSPSAIMMRNRTAVRMVFACTQIGTPESRRPCGVENYLEEPVSRRGFI